MRSKGTLFWTIAFPVILIVIFGAIFYSGDISYTIHIADHDQTTSSIGFIQNLNNKQVLEMKDETGNITTNLNISNYMNDNNIKWLLVISEGFEQKLQSSQIDPSVTVPLDFYYDPADQSSPVVQSIINSISQEMNLQLSQGRNYVTVDYVSTMQEEFGFIDFFVPGMIGFTIMQSCIYGSIERNTKYRKDGILRKLLTTPITRSEWIFSKMLFMLFLSFISTILIIIVGWIIWGVSVHINPLMIIIIIATSFLFSGMGMLIGRFVKEEETADTAGGAISFPMMFLAGTFFPLDQMDPFLQNIAQVLPLYYVNEGLRNAMIYLKMEDALINTLAVVIFAAIFFVSGVLLTKWHED
jgi:ABC-2 type transport system permease protein